MLRIWGRATSSNVAKVMWTVAELDLPHERIDVGGSFGGTDTPRYRALNPTGQIPTIEDDGFVLWESNAIVRYLAAKFGGGTLWPDDPQARGSADRWMDFASTGTAPAIDALRAAYRAPRERQDAAVTATALAAAAAQWRIVDDSLGDRPFLGGSRLSVADIGFGSLLHRWHLVPLERPALARVSAWYERLCARPAYRTHIVDVVR